MLKILHLPMVWVSISMKTLNSFIFDIPLLERQPPHSCNKLEFYVQNYLSYKEYKNTLQVMLDAKSNLCIVQL